MALMIKKKRYKFQVDLTLNELTAVSFGKAILFAKVRQLNGGDFQATSDREEVVNHAVKYDFHCSFPAKMAANSSTGVLDSCKARVSIRKEEKGGKNFRKIGFVDLDLAEYAGAGPSTQRCILQAYDTSHRLDNSLLQIRVAATLREGDLVFSRPPARSAQTDPLPGEEEEAMSCPSPPALTLSAPPQEDAASSSSDRSPSSSSLLPRSRRASGDQWSVGSWEAHRMPASACMMPSSRLEKDARRRWLESGREDAEAVVDELMAGLELEMEAEGEDCGAGLQLFLAKDGSVRFDSQPSEL